MKQIFYNFIGFLICASPVFLYFYNEWYSMPRDMDKARKEFEKQALENLKNVKHRWHV